MKNVQKVVIRKADSIDYLISKLGVDPMIFTEDVYEARILELDMADPGAFEDVTKECDNHNLVAIGVHQPILLGSVLYRGGMPCAKND